MNYSFYNSPIGDLTLVSDGNFLLEIKFGKYFLDSFKFDEDKILYQTKRELEEYFNKERKVFSVPIKLEGTFFQKKVWNALMTISYGIVMTYKDISEIINNKNAFRAVGLANSKNPIPIIVPCHRVINSNGEIGGYSLGVEIKKNLLELENYIIV